MPETPPAFANYPRGGSPFGSSAKLQSLADGYYGYGPLFLIHVVLALAVAGLSFSMGDAGGFVYLGGIFALMIGMGFLSYRVNRKVGLGADWSTVQIVLASVTIALGTVCYGILGYIILQQIAANHIKKYGIKTGFFGLKKKAIKERIAELQAAEAA